MESARKQKRTLGRPCGFAFQSKEPEAGAEEGGDGGSARGHLERVGAVARAAGAGTGARAGTRAVGADTRGGGLGGSSGGGRAEGRGGSLGVLGGVGEHAVDDVHHTVGSDVVGHDDLGGDVARGDVGARRVGHELELVARARDGRGRIPESGRVDHRAVDHVGALKSLGERRGTKLTSNTRGVGGDGEHLLDGLHADVLVLRTVHGERKRDVARGELDVVGVVALLLGEHDDLATVARQVDVGCHVERRRGDGLVASADLAVGDGAVQDYRSAKAGRRVSHCFVRQEKSRVRRRAGLTVVGDGSDESLGGDVVAEAGEGAGWKGRGRSCCRPGARRGGCCELLPTASASAERLLARRALSRPSAKAVAFSPPLFWARTPAWRKERQRRARSDRSCTGMGVAAGESLAPKRGPHAQLPGTDGRHGAMSRGRIGGRTSHSCKAEERGAQPQRTTNGDCESLAFLAWRWPQSAAMWWRAGGEQGAGEGG
ncbi:hypothetical protein L1887_48181 [Cichorium endivia]|nr:hypothetical protein L1887_48181 [Cichorium endivia]